MSAPLDHEGNTFEPTQRWRPATVFLEALLSLVVLLLIACLAFGCWLVLAHKPDAFGFKSFSKGRAALPVVDQQVARAGVVLRDRQRAS